MQQRTPEQMQDLLLGFARQDDRVRAVWLNGSRANPNAPKDRWQDFDVVFAVRDYASFLADPHWVDRFGQRVIMQTRSDQEPPDANFSDWYIYLMQFADGNRIDLTLLPLEGAVDAYLADSMRVLWLDKDGLLPPVPPSTDAAYTIQKPDAAAFAHCCNEFLWVSTYVVKGLWRDEMPYAQAMYHGCVREAFDCMARWRIGVAWGFDVNPGKLGKWYGRFLPAPEYAQLLATYDCGSAAALLQSLLRLLALFQQWGLLVAAAFGYTYPVQEHRQVTAYLLSQGDPATMPMDVWQGKCLDGAGE